MRRERGIGWFVRIILEVVEVSALGRVEIP